jgi:hypothetical protein
MTEHPHEVAAEREVGERVEHGAGEAQEAVGESPGHDEAKAKEPDRD